MAGLSPTARAECDYYPHGLEIGDRCQRTVKYIGEVSFRELFTGSFQSTLISCRQDWSDDARVLDLVDNLIGALPEETTLLELMTQDRAYWPKGVAEACWALESFVTIACNYLPDRLNGVRTEQAKDRVKRFCDPMDAGGDGFFEIIGGYSMKLLFCTAKTSHPEKNIEYVQFAKDFGLLSEYVDPQKLEQARAFGDNPHEPQRGAPNGFCCSGGSCVAGSKYCQSSGGGCNAYSQGC